MVDSEYSNCFTLSKELLRSITPFVVISSRILLSRHGRYLVFSAFTSWPVFWLATSSSSFVGVTIHYRFKPSQWFSSIPYFPYPFFSTLLFPSSGYLPQCLQPIFSLVFLLFLQPIGFHSNILLGILPPSIRITCPSQTILPLFINLTMSALPMSSWFFLILQVLTSN